MRSSTPTVGTSASNVVETIARGASPSSVYARHSPPKAEGSGRATEINANVVADWISSDRGRAAGRASSISRDHCTVRRGEAGVEPLFADPRRSSPESRRLPAYRPACRLLLCQSGRPRFRRIRLPAPPTASLSARRLSVSVKDVDRLPLAALNSPADLGGCLSQLRLLIGIHQPLACTLRTQLRASPQSSCADSCGPARGRTGNSREAGARTLGNLLRHLVRGHLVRVREVRTGQLVARSSPVEGAWPEEPHGRRAPRPPGWTTVPTPPSSEPNRHEYRRTLVLHILLF